MAGWLTLKIYLNYYDISYANAIMSSEWKTVINPTSSGHNWFIINKQKYGTLKSYKWPIIIYSMFNISAVYIWEVTHSDNLLSGSLIHKYLTISPQNKYL